MPLDFKKCLLLEEQLNIIQPHIIPLQSVSVAKRVKGTHLKNQVGINKHFDFSSTKNVDSFQVCRMTEVNVISQQRTISYFGLPMFLIILVD
jgi:hypothetical protein